jgi:hypothetical protein
MIQILSIDIVEYFFICMGLQYEEKIFSQVY